MPGQPPKDEEEKNPEPLTSVDRVLGSLKKAVASAHEDAPATDVLLARAATPAAMKIIALLVSGDTRKEFSSPKSHRDWRQALGELEMARVQTVRAVQGHMGPAAATIFLVKLAAVICERHDLDANKLCRLLRHFSAPVGTPERLPTDILLEMGAMFVSRDDAEGGTSDYDEP